MSLKPFLLTSAFFFLLASSFPQNNWTLKTDKEGILVYTQDLENSPFKAIKTVCTIDATLSSLTAVLLDINNSKEWVYATKTCTLLKKFSPTDLIYYSEVEIPWPLTNRDFIVQLKVSQDPKTKAVTIEGDTKPTYLPEKRNVVRIHRSYSKWVIMPLTNGQLRIEYTLEVDPAGTVPAWLINMFATKGPFESFKELRKQVKKPMYNQVTLAFIKN